MSRVFVTQSSVLSLSLALLLSPVAAQMAPTQNKAGQNQASQTPPARSAAPTTRAPESESSPRPNTSATPSQPVAYDPALCGLPGITSDGRQTPATGVASTATPPAKSPAPVGAAGAGQTPASGSPAGKASGAAQGSAAGTMTPATAAPAAAATPAAAPPASPAMTPTTPATAPTVNKSAAGAPVTGVTAPAPAAQNNAAAGGSPKAAVGTPGTGGGGVPSSPAQINLCFVQHAALGDQFEIQSSKLAQAQASTAGVKTYAARMITEHTAVSTALATLAAQLKLKPATTLEPGKAQTLVNLRSLRQVAFDRAYLAGQLSAHQEAVNLYAAYARGGQDARLKAFATKNLPTLRAHLQQVQQLQTQVGK
jgi:putative membrane protein